MSEPEDLADQHQLFELLDRIVDLPPEERSQVLAASPPTLAQEVAKMLGGNEPAEEFLSPPVIPNSSPLHPAVQLSTIGPYRLLHSLGEGGMGQVFLAEQLQPVRRRVALKVLRFAVAGQESRARFEAERHAMGRLDHPNIGRILEAGTTDDGLPFFAMEFIDGPPITQFCDERCLSVEERLQLFVEVCRGAAYAHHKLLLHRDLKPSNILVAEIDGRPVPKIIDFGIAKGLDGSLVEAPLATGNRLIGTPVYMSPEALAGTEVDTRSDVFSLGILLYELLTGTRPWSTKAKDPLSILKSRLEKDLRSPSSRAARLEAEDLHRVARHRGEDPTTLPKKLRGDLDWIVLKAAAQEPHLRYGSATEFGADVSRFLRHEPVTARPATATYLFRKLVLRHRAVFGVALVALLAIVLGGVGTSIGFVRARQAEVKAVSEAMEARHARDAAQEVADFLIGLFAATGLEAPNVQKPPAEITALELLERGSALLDGELQHQPLTKARLGATIGGVYRELGLYDRSLEHLEAALSLLESLPETTPRDIARAHRQVAGTLVKLTNPSQAEHHLNKGLALIEGATGNEDQQLRAALLENLGRLERRQGNFEASERYLQMAVRLFREHPQVDHRNLAATLTNLGTTYFVQTRWVEAEVHYREVLELYLLHGNPGALRMAQAKDNLAAAIASQDRLLEALPLFEEALEERRRLLGDSHPELANSLNNVGMAQLDSGHPLRAEQLHREALAIRKKTFGPEHPYTAWSLDNLARALEDQGQKPEAILLQRQALAIRQKAFKPHHPQVVRSLEHLEQLTANATNRDTLPQK